MNISSPPLPKRPPKLPDSGLGATPGAMTPVLNPKLTQALNAPSHIVADVGRGPTSLTSKNGAIVTSDEFPTAVEHLPQQTPVIRHSHPGRRQKVSDPKYCMSGAGTGPLTSRNQTDTDKVYVPPAQSADPQPQHIYNGHAQTGHGTGLHPDTAFSSHPLPIKPASSPTPSFISAPFAPDSISGYHPSPTPTYVTPEVIRPIAIPQITPEPNSPLLLAFPPQLQALGISRDKWLAFLASLSAILGASDAENSRAHRTDINRELKNIPKDFGQSVTDHATYLSNDVKTKARSGKVLSATGAVLSGTVVWPVTTTAKAVKTVFHLPSATVKAVSKKPQKRHERAAAVVEAAGQGWLNERGFHPCLMGTEELACIMGVDAAGKLLQTGSGGSADAAETMKWIVERFQLGELVVEQDLGELKVGAGTMWLVLVPCAAENSA